MTFEGVRVGADGGPPKMDHTDLYGVVRADDPQSIAADYLRGELRAGVDAKRVLIGQQVAACNAKHCREHAAPPVRTRPDLDATRAALRREIGPVGSASAEGGWGPMVAAYEVNDLLLALDDTDVLCNVITRTLPGWDGTITHLARLLDRLGR